MGVRDLALGARSTMSVGGAVAGALDAATERKGAS
jgi:hypothetical protein